MWSWGGRRRSLSEHSRAKTITRRELCAAAGGLFPALAAAANANIVLPLLHVVDRRARWKPEQIGAFWSTLWPEAAREFERCGVRVENRVVEGEVKRSPGDRPIFQGALPGVLNLVITDLVPLRWDRGRGLPGVTTRYDGCDLCVIALQYAHGNQVPLASLNTCVHEMLHALSGDIRERHPEGASGAAREFRVDWYATAMWLLGGSTTVREFAQRYRPGW